MRDYPTLLGLLESEVEPSRSVYDETVNGIIRHPEHISSLAQGQTKEKTLLHLTTHSHRLAHVFHRLHAFQKLQPKPPIRRRPAFVRDHAFQHLPPEPPARDRIASETVNLLLEILPTFPGIIEIAQVVELLVPALENCFVSQPPTLRKLASVLAGYGNILEHLASDESGGETMCHWVCLPITVTQDAATLETWTRRLVDLVESCTVKHGIPKEIQRWGTLIGLKRALHRLQENIERESQLRSQQLTRDATSSSARFTALDPDNKKAHVTSRQGAPEGPDAHALTLEDDLLVSLKEFGLEVPSSRSELQQAIQTLKGETTVSILRVIAKTFPCKLCKEALSLAAPRTNSIFTAVSDKSLAAVSNLQVDILGKSVGDWKVLLSVQALKSIQGLNRSGHFGPIQEKLLSLASGEWKYRLAGSEKQRKLLRVPLAMNKCGQKTFILWQVDVGIAGEMEVPQQLIKIWEVGNPSEISKSIERVAVLQRTYSAEIIRRCQQRPPSLDGKQLPAQFKDHPQDFAVSSRRPTDLDVRVVDQDTIDMANKFYALTAPMIRSILANDLTAEFPFDLSPDEIQVIGHFQTASLILGRSGTGKTTCLVFKLVGKHLARRRLPGERRLRQVLLTRSSFLADKLRAYVRRLIETLTSKSLNLEVLQEDDDPLMSFAEGTRTNDSALTLSDDSYPLVCTFDRFLKLLENTVRAMDRKNFHNSEAHASNQAQEVKLTLKRPKGQFIDFQTFRLDYWPHLPHRITKHVSVDLVFAEIMGVIKGSASSRESLIPLSREEYLTRSSRLAPAFQSEVERSRVYEAFQAYEDLKVASEGVDHVDRVVRLLRAVRGDPLLQQLLGSSFDEVYIDEVQDQRGLDFELLLSFIKDSRGFHFAGDTAQAISQDSTFRFADIKALFHDHFAATSAAANQRQLAQTIMFTLNKNYRSHQGILALASLVMAMLWKVGCGIEIFVSSNVGHVKLSERSADFGAEQVILVRDEKMKTRLQDQIGDVALVLTILQSKGMEFDDVILWNFFSESPSPAGIRSLNALVKDETAVFDARKNSAMCSDLKHLYVAVTRARIQLFLIESDEAAIASVVKLLTQDVPESLVEVTQLNDANFAASLETLRPGTSNDPRRWSLRAEQLMQQRSYKDALMCFAKAKDHRGETIARAKIYEEDGRICDAEDDIEGFRQNLEAAVGHFLEMNFIGEASRNLVRMAQFERAADLWLQNRDYGKAAQLFANSDLHEKAAECYHWDGRYVEAAAALRKGGKFDQLVSYLSLNREQIPLNAHRTYSRLCKLLLKQGKISREHRKDAIAILGSHTEQEACFIEYEMYDDLVNFYMERQRHKDLFSLLVKMCLFEKALSVWLKQQSSESANEIPEDEILNVLDYVWAGRMMSASPKDAAAKFFEEPGYILLPNVARKVQQWGDAYRIYTQSSTTLEYAGLKSSKIKDFLSLQSILDTTAMYQASDLDGLPFKMIQEAIKVSKDLALKGDSKARRTTLLLTGVWTTDDSKKPSFLLPWSPLREAITDASAVDLTQTAKQWVLDRLASATLALDIKADELFKKKHPLRCLQYLLKEFCSKKRRGENCPQLHERLRTVDCSRIIEDLRRVSAVFCDLTVMHNRNIMTREFQEKFLPIRRRWLERLLRQLTYVSPFEQDASIISKIQAEELRSGKASVIGSCLENLLYHRLGKDWAQRSDFSSLLEQMQLAKTFGQNFHSRFFRALSYKLWNISNRGVMQQHLRLLNSLEDDSRTPNALLFQRGLEKFLTDLESLDVQELSSMHAVTSVIEYLALLLILRTSSQAFIVPQSWIELYIPRMSQSSLSPSSLVWEDTQRYHECLLQLVQTFSGLLTRLDKALQQGWSFSYGRRKYHQSLLQQRNAEFLAIGLVNLPTFQSGISTARHYANEVFRYSSVRADHLEHKNPDELGKKLASSFAMYEGKNPLVIVSKDPRRLQSFSKFQNEAGVTTRSMDDVRSLMIRPTSPDTTTGRTSSSTILDEKYTQAETEAVGRIQTFWRSSIPKVKLCREYMLSSEAQAIQFYIDLGSRHSVPVALRALLVSRGVAAHLRFPVLRDSIAEQHKTTLSCVMDAEVSDQSNETIDDALQLVSQLSHSLEKAVEQMSEEHLGKLLSGGILSNMQDAMNLVEKAIEDAEGGMVKARKMTNEMSGYRS